MAEEDWRTANETVGEFTRGHIDILRWEAENPPPSFAEPLPAGEHLSMSAAVRIAFGNRPDLFATEDMNALARARADIAATAFARDVQRAWIQAVAAEQGLRRTGEAFEATEIAAELAARMTRVGNWGQDRLLREQLGLSDAGIQLAQTRQQAMSAREALVRKLGLWGDGLDFALPDALPPLPTQPLSGEGLEARALRTHPALRLAAIEAERSQRAVGSRTWSMWTEAAEDALSRAVAAGNDNGDPLAHPIEGAPVLKRRQLPRGHDAEKTARAAAEAAALAVTIRSQVREAYHQYQVAYDIARRADENQRLGEDLQEETLLRYNGMLDSTWDLLASARDRVERSSAAVQALGDFWLAHANLQAVVAGAEYPGPDAGSLRVAGRADAGGH
ncbi:Copper tolerance protein [Thioalkalivibrio nitratireducens DSM 14787]|uniref:Copper tolerance protein n=2 Tax=Thioalkalivibrio nitratireducens TaxID=186931 RepID=L0DT49_THIND|nr:Copper tolerance protein [Thioalkalivibrio nitratireducens DSM 14787]